MTAASSSTLDVAAAVEIRVRGLVQGVGFRPTVWRWATELRISGQVLNDAEGVLIRATGTTAALAILQRRLRDEPPPIARIEAIEVAPWRPVELPRGFEIMASQSGGAHTDVAADLAICEACRGEILDPASRRHGYAFTNCTRCGPRLSIITGLPYDRARTTMAAFDMCNACRNEYESPQDRRFHAQPIACPACGPQLRLVALDRRGVATHGIEAIAHAAELLKAGYCVAVKGIGGYQLACDATNVDAVTRLRVAKRRPTKPFALMARDVDVIRRYAMVTHPEEQALLARAAPIVLLDAPLQLDAGAPETAHDMLHGIAPGLDQLGCMLPATPLHVLLMESFDVPLVMTSGNVSDEPQIIDDAEACDRLVGIASHVLAHDRPIALRLDDSVVRHEGTGIRVLRRARGYAPAQIAMPEGFRSAPPVLAFGAEFKATFCILKDGEAVLSPHQGDLQDAATFDDYRNTIVRMCYLLEVKPHRLAADLHPDYASTRLAEEQGRLLNLPVERVQHHHAHLASCLAENGRPLEAPPVLGLVLDGTGLGADGTVWGGELLVADYQSFRRVGRLKPIAMPGGEAAAREPWRNLYAHLAAALGWPTVMKRYGRLPAVRALKERPVALLDRMIASGLNAPLASSSARLFDAVAAACGLAPDRVSYEGEAAMRLEAAAGRFYKRNGDSGPYAFAIAAAGGDGLVEIDPAPMWRELLDDLARGEPDVLVAASFHDGFADALVAAAIEVIRREAEAGRVIATVALSGGVFHNRLLLDRIASKLGRRGLDVLRHGMVPAGDGGLALGQAVVTAARALAKG